MGTKKIIIIGAGIAGLSAGCYARMNGYDVSIFEMHDKPGGVCTSWNRQGYTFDYCIHNLPGTGKKSAARKLWDELGAFEGTEIINHDVFARIEDSSGRGLNIYSNLDRLEDHLKELAPADTVLINHFIGAARSLVGVDLMSMVAGSLINRLKMLPHLLTLSKWGKTNLDLLARYFKDPFVRRAYSHAQYNIPPSQIPAVLHMVFLAGLHSGDLGVPKGGSLAFSRRIEKKYREMGGEINYKARVEKILVQEDRAVGIQLADGSEYRADLVISAADGYSTIYDLLDGRYTNDYIDDFYFNPPESEAFGLALFLGLSRDLAHEPHALTLLLDEPVQFESEPADSLHLVIFDSKTGFAPAGKSVLKVETVGNYEYWKELRQDPDRYYEAKKQVYERIIDKLEPRFPGIRDQVEVYDIVTPPTVERYTNAYHGWQPWSHPTQQNRVMKQGLSRTLPGLQNFYMTGHWAGGIIGVSTVAAMGRGLIQEICNKDGKKFRNDY